MQPTLILFSTIDLWNENLLRSTFSVSGSYRGSRNATSVCAASSSYTAACSSIPTPPSFL